MYGKVITLLLIEDDKVDQIAFNRFAVEQTFDFNYQIAGSISAARELLAKRSFDIIVSDYFLGDGTALDILKEFKNLPLIIVTGAGDEAIAVNAMKMGAYDYLSKDIEGNYLLKISIAIDNVLKRWNLEQKVKHYHENLELIVNERTKLLKNEIAERITIQHSLEDSEKKYKQLVENSLAGIYISQDHYIKFCNSQFATIFGFDNPKEMLDIHTSELVKGVDWPFVYSEVVKRIVGGKEFSHFNVKGIKKDSSEFDLELLGSTILYEGGPAIQGMALDITERSRALKALEESEENYHDLYDNAPEMYISIDVKTSKIIKCNRTFLDDLGYERNNIIGEKVFLIFDPEDRARAEEILISIRNNGDINNAEFKLLKGTDTVSVIMNATAIRSANGEVILCRASFRDITDRITAKEKLLQSQNELEKSLADKDKCFSIISHDLRNPLTTICDITQMLDDKLDELQQKEIKDLIRTLRKKTTDISELLKELLD